MGRRWSGRAWGWILFLAVVMSAGEARAGGYAQGFQGAAAAGVSGAMTARPTVPEAGYFNPAGFVLQGEWGVSGGASGIFPFVSHEDPASRERTRAEVDGAFPPNFHGFGRWRNFAAGLSLGIPYGSGLQWPEDWSGRFEVTSTRLTAYEAAPSVAWRPVKWLAIGGGPRLVVANVGFQRQIDVARPGEEASVDLNATTTGLGGQIGLWAKPLDLLSVGVSWRSAVTLDFEGVARFENVPLEMQHQARDARAETTLVLPDRVALGVGYELGAFGMLSLDLEYNRWSVYETFEVRFDNQGEEGPEDLVERRDWEDTLTMRFGVEYFSPLDGLAIRSGFAIDPSPAQEETLSPAQPDMDRYIMSLGAGYQAGERLYVDMAYNYVILSRTASAGDFAGIYDGQVHVFSLGITLR